MGLGVLDATLCTLIGSTAEGVRSPGGGQERGERMLRSAYAAFAELMRRDRGILLEGAGRFEHKASIRNGHHRQKSQLHDL
jgi:hypothetical protein